MGQSTRRLIMAAAGAGGGGLPVDDVFSTDLWKGNSTTQTITNGIDLSGEGGLVWIKGRNDTWAHALFDTERGPGYELDSTNNNAHDSDTQVNNQKDLYQFNSTGYSIGQNYNSYINRNGDTFVGWSFRKAPGFFDVIKYTGNGSTRNISHSLESIPGMIIIKAIGLTENWYVWHRDMQDANSSIRLNYESPEANNYNQGFGGPSAVLPTATHFTLGNGYSFNNNGSEYIAYVFAGGASSAATARSVDFDGSGDSLTVASSSDFAFGTGDFTIEAWCYRTGGVFFAFDHLMGQGNFTIFSYSNANIQAYSTSVAGGFMDSGINPGNKRWFHLAVVRESGTLSFYIDGVKAPKTYTFNLNITTAGVNIGQSQYSEYSNGLVSNLRVVKGTALYTSSFRPPYEPLTSITNTVLLCCNNSSTTGKTTGGTITANGNPTASTDSPFDDPEGFKFGKGEDQNVIKCGSYIGNGNANGPEINVGWEPQWVLVKSTTSSRPWVMWDVMRGIVTDGNDPRLKPNALEVEGANDAIDVTSTGFKFKNAAANWNENNQTFIYMVIRRSDGYVGKTPSLGTDVFAIDTGNGSSNIPTFDSGFPVDMAFYKYQITGTADWILSTRLLGTNYVKTNSTAAQTSFQYFTWDSNVGWANEGNAHSGYYSWMWKRYAGCDVVCYDGLGASSAPRTYSHSLGKPPEMIWTKGRNSTYNWRVWHKDLGSGGASAAPFYLVLNGTDAQTANGDVFGGSGNLLPTSTHWTTGGNNTINESGTKQITYLFASVSGISKVGSFIGNGTSSSSTQTITTGFSPRFLIIKNITDANSWFVADTVRGWASGDDQLLMLDSNSGQLAIDWGVPTSSGFTVTGNNTGFNANTKKYIYYAHA